MTDLPFRGALTILVVEDEPIVRNIIMKSLVHEDYRVLEADSAAEALEVSQTFPGTIDLLIADHTNNERSPGSRADSAGPAWSEGAAHLWSFA